MNTIAPTVNTIMRLYQSIFRRLSEFVGGLNEHVMASFQWQTGLSILLFRDVVQHHAGYADNNFPHHLKQNYNHP